MTLRAAARCLAFLLPLAACETPAEPPRSATAARVPDAPALPIGRFDGRYAGTVTLSPDRTRACPEASNEERELTVRNGRAVFVLNPQNRQTLTGTIAPEGSVRMADSIDRNIATSGLFTATGFRGEHRSGLCTYAVQLTKRS
jgi:hypothetical protein